MQAFDAELTDAQLAELLDPEGRSFSVQVDDTPERLVAHPRGFPLWFLTVCMVTPVAIYTGILVNKAFQGGLRALDFLGLAFGYLATTSLIGLLRWLNQKEVNRGDFFILDKVQRTLTLPRSGVQLQHGQIQGFVEVHAWHTVRCTDPGDKSSTSDYLTELSVLVSNEDGKFARYPVISCQRTGPVRRLGETLAEFFGVERRVITLNWRTRRRLKAERT